MACLQRGLDAGRGRGFDQLPPEVLSVAEAALVRSVDREELLRALAVAVQLLIATAKADPERGDVPELVSRLEPQLLELLGPLNG